jgi:TonB-linked SusC/RagA family outer membrane protein
MTTVDEALQGRIAGLDIVQNSGNLGAGTTMRLRGVSTINGNQNPLVVVNGNILSNDDLSESFDYSNANEERFAELLNVNPEDIESITVLKDAAACAIWGSRGANGVIEIKTKRGARGKTRVSYSYRFTGSWQPEGYKLLNGDDYTMYMKEAYFNPRQQSGFADKNSADFIPEIAYAPEWSEYHMYNDNTDWVDAVKQFGANQQHYVSLDGGGEKANFRISGGYDYATGSIIRQYLNRFTTRVALDYFVSDRIKASTNFDCTYTNNDRNNTQGALGDAYRKMPNLSIYREDEFGNDLPEYYTMNRYITKQTGVYDAARVYLEDQYNIKNPIAVAHNSRQKERNTKLAPEFILGYEILGTQPEETRLKYEGQIRFDINSNDNDSYMPGWLSSNNQFSGSYNNSRATNYKSHSLSTRHKFTFTPHFKAEGHSLQMMGQYEYSQGNSSTQASGTWMMPTTDDITSSLGGGIINTFETGAGEWKSQYLTFQGHYSYKGKYSVTTTLRGDCKTAFGPERRWGFFPSLSLRWNISDEPFMEPVRWLSMLSIRPSWGIVGNAPGGEGMSEGMLPVILYPCLLTDPAIETIYLGGLYYPILFIVVE